MGPLAGFPLRARKSSAVRRFIFYPRFGNETEIVAMQRSHLAVILALAFLSVWNVWGLGWGPEPDGPEDEKGGQSPLVTTKPMRRSVRIKRRQSPLATTNAMRTWTTT